MDKRQKFSFSDISYIALFITIIAYMLMSAHVSAQPKYEHFIEVEVKNGDTLWSIASKYTDGVTVQSYITILKEQNNLRDHHIYAGQVLLVPQQTNKDAGVENESDHLLSSKY
ncbi:MAG: LysM peptidoglycan-binding domain-containing protein [Anaerobacillus sp.]|uniref:cell division suppressor protein YneA n=1 Tax=Anaerobacillus sp. TaxID=1872506 RepID=UPI00391931EB